VPEISVKVGHLNTAARKLWNPYPSFVVTMNSIIYNASLLLQAYAPYLEHRIHLTECPELKWEGDAGRAREGRSEQAIDLL
jgi:hypothetical protein